MILVWETDTMLHDKLLLTLFLMLNSGRVESTLARETFPTLRHRIISHLNPISIVALHTSG